MKKKRTALCILMALLLSLLCACASSTEPTITVGKDEVATLYAAVGERKITGTAKGIENDVQYVTLTYDAGEITQEDMSAYLARLREDGYLVTRDSVAQGDTSSVQLGKESVEEGKIVLIDIQFSLGGSAEIRYAVGMGEITKNQ